jgi:hypothetical protein
MAGVGKDLIPASSYRPRWVRVQGQTICQECKQWVDVSWRWYATRTASTFCWCEPCVGLKLGAA